MIQCSSSFISASLFQAVLLTSGVWPVCSYQLGVCEMQVEDCAAPVLQRNLDIPGADSVAAAQCAHLTDRLERLESDVLKVPSKAHCPTMIAWHRKRCDKGLPDDQVQNLLLLHNERLEAMELGMPSSLPSAMHGPIPPSAPCTRPQTGMEGLLLTAAACQPARRPAAASAPAEGVAAPKQLRHPQPLHSQVAAGVAASSQPSSELEAAAGCTSAGQDLDDAPPALVKKYKRKRADESARPQAGVDGAKRAR